MTFSHLGLGMGNGQDYSQILVSGMGMTKAKTQHLGLRLGIKIQFSTFGIGKGNKKLLTIFWAKIDALVSMHQRNI